MLTGRYRPSARSSMPNGSQRITLSKSENDILFTMKYRTFISSLQREFARERKALAGYIRRDALFGRFFVDADLKKAHSSLPPNELLALPMYLKGAIEKAGTGTEDMVKQCRSWGLADPEFQDVPDFRIVIRLQPVPGNAQVKEKVNDTVNEKVNERQRKIISIILNDPYVTQLKLSIALGISLVHVNKNMKRLRNLGLIRRVGPDKGGHWEVIG